MARVPIHEVEELFWKWAFWIVLVIVILITLIGRLSADTTVATCRIKEKADSLVVCEGFDPRTSVVFRIVDGAVPDLVLRDHVGATVDVRLWRVR